ncbi:MAG: RNA polymerase sigma factor [Crocinitomicaceae bacterium]
MKHVKGGKNLAFEELFNRYSQKMLFYFYNRLYQDHEKAQDFVQDLFLRLIEKSETFDESKKFSSWFYAIAFNMCKNEYRRNESSIKVDDYDIEGIMEASLFRSFSSEYDLELFKEQLEKELNGMSEKHSSVFRLRYEESLSIYAISQLLDCSEGTVKSRLFYAARKLSDKLQLFNTNVYVKNGN